jgi:hypothetical protein
VPVGHGRVPLVAVGAGGRLARRRARPQKVRKVCNSVGASALQSSAARAVQGKPAVRERQAARLGRWEVGWCRVGTGRAAGRRASGPPIGWEGRARCRVGGG